eukprot:GHVQ01037995.1.p1 GENE.GHVQ01037995.1~~GHVQ01037995.1.p1  ORF type:complete len:796 (+),score=81.71 GHVQ01037995.1:431-2818(+)
MTPASPRTRLVGIHASINTRDPCSPAICHTHPIYQSHSDPGGGVGALQELLNVNYVGLTRRDGRLVDQDQEGPCGSEGGGEGELRSHARRRWGTLMEKAGNRNCKEALLATRESLINRRLDTSCVVSGSASLTSASISSSLFTGTASRVRSPKILVWVLLLVLSPFVGDVFEPLWLSQRLLDGTYSYADHYVVPLNRAINTDTSYHTYPALRSSTTSDLCGCLSALSTNVSVVCSSVLGVVRGITGGLEQGGAQNGRRRGGGGMVLLAAGQLRVREPRDLFNALRQTGAFTTDNDNTLTGATATYGTPQYGRSFVGRAYYVKDMNEKSHHDEKHCKLDYCQVIKQQQEEYKNFYESPSMQWQEKTSSMPYTSSIVFVDRGACPFAQKVMTAENECNATAVVVVDKESTHLSRYKIQRLVMGAIGSTDHVHIPSILISYEDGAVLVDAIEKSSHQYPVVLELEWQLPVQWPVDVNLFTDSDDRGNEFLHGFAEYALMLKGHMYFRPNYMLFYLPSDNEGYCMPLEGGPFNSSDGTRLTSMDFCALPPFMKNPLKQRDDLSTTLKGRDIVLEDLRQLCLWQVASESDPDVPHGVYSPLYWEYHSVFWGQSGCRFELPNMGTVEGFKNCSLKLIRQLLPSEILSKFNACLSSDIGINLLLQSRSSRGWSVQCIQINGAKLSGRMDPENVASAVCASLKLEGGGYRAPQCANLMTQVELEQPWAPHVGIPWSSIFTVVLFMFVIAGLILYMSHRHMRAQMNISRRDEVALEVRSQMKSYYNLEEQDEKEYSRSARSPLV